MHVFGLWVEARVLRENPQGHRENPGTPCREVTVLTTTAQLNVETLIIIFKISRFDKCRGVVHVFLIYIIINYEKCYKHCFNI